MFGSLQSSRFNPHRYRPGGIGNWSGHLPFAADLIDALKPSVVVELGTHLGESYFGFCQAIRAQGLSCQAYAIDTWVGDSQTGRYGPEVFRDVSAYNAEHYQSFSILLRASFDAAVESFSDGTIDLLHLDGCHTHEAILHDFGTWLPKVRARGVILIHDIAVREGEFGAWRFWEDVSQSYPSFAFHHGCGLGVILKGDSAGIDTPFLAKMFSGTVDPRGIRDYYVLCAERLHYAHQTATEFASFCEVLSPGTTGYSLERSASCPVSAGAIATLEFSLPSPSGRLRLDPCNCACMIEISDIVVECPSSGAILWRLDPAQLHKVQSAGTSIRIPDESRLILCSYGDDPQLYLPSLEYRHPEEPVRVLCTLRIDRDWQAIARSWRQVEAYLSRARRDAHAQRAKPLDAELARVRDERHADVQYLSQFEGEVVAGQTEALHIPDFVAEIRRLRTENEACRQGLRDAETELLRMSNARERQSREMLAEVRASRTELDSVRASSEAALAEGAAFKQSLSWRITAPLRYLGLLLRFR